jgi:hypothetical protein
MIFLGQDRNRTDALRTVRSGLLDRIGVPGDVPLEGERRLISAIRNGD